MKLPIRVLVVDDHPVVREGLAAILRRQPDMVVAATAADGREAVAQYFAQTPDVVLLDLNLPVMDGWTVLAEIRSRDAQARVIAISSFQGDADIERAMRAGAKGYLWKDAEAEEILSAVRAVSKGLRYLPPGPASALAAALDYEPLSARERQILKLVAKGKSNREIGAALALAESTVKWHLNAILAKLRVDDRTAAVTLATERGLLR